MDIVLVCNVKDMYSYITSTFIDKLMSLVSDMNNIDIIFDYTKSKIHINVYSNKGESMYIKRCLLENLLDEIKKLNLYNL